MATKDLKDFVVINGRLHFRDSDGVFAQVLSLTEARIWGLSLVISSFNRGHIDG